MAAAAALPGLDGDDAQRRCCGFGVGLLRTAPHRRDRRASGSRQRRHRRIAVAASAISARRHPRRAAISGHAPVASASSCRFHGTGRAPSPARPAGRSLVAPRVVRACWPPVTRRRASAVTAALRGARPFLQPPSSVARMTLSRRAASVTECADGFVGDPVLAPRGWAFRCEAFAVRRGTSGPDRLDLFFADARGNGSGGEVAWQLLTLWPFSHRHRLDTADAVRRSSVTSPRRWSAATSSGRSGGWRGGGDRRGRCSARGRGVAWTSRARWWRRAAARSRRSTRRSWKSAQPAARRRAAASTGPTARAAVARRSSGARRRGAPGGRPRGPTRRCDGRARRRLPTRAPTPSSTGCARRARRRGGGGGGDDGAPAAAAAAGRRRGARSGTPWPPCMPRTKGCAVGAALAAGEAAGDGAAGGAVGVSARGRRVGRCRGPRRPRRSRALACARRNAAGRGGVDVDGVHQRLFTATAAGAAEHIFSHVRHTMHVEYAAVQNLGVHPPPRRRRPARQGQGQGRSVGCAARVPLDGRGPDEGGECHRGRAEGDRRGPRRRGRRRRTTTRARSGRRRRRRPTARRRRRSRASSRSRAGGA